MSPTRIADGPAPALFEVEDLVTTPCTRCRAQAVTRVRAAPDLIARIRPYRTAPALHAGATSTPMCAACAAWLASAWQHSHRAPCGHAFDLWHVRLLPLT